MQRLKQFYQTTVTPKLQKTFEYKNEYELPKIKKIIVNRGFDESCQNKKTLDNLTDEMKLICGQSPIFSKAKKAIASFKVKEGMIVGMHVTLRGEKMYSFLDRLINLALPRIRDFQGLSIKGFDKKGNYTLGLKEQLMFPEIEFDKVIKNEGMNICIVIKSKSKKESELLLKELGLPFRS